MRSLAGAVVVVTGASGAIGAEIAHAAARSGAHVIGIVPPLDSDAGRLRSRTAADGLAVDVLEADVSDYAAVATAAHEVVERFGGVDILINNAAIFRAIGPLWEADPIDWRRDVEVDLIGTFNCCRAFLPSMVEHGEGAIVNLVGGGFDGPNLGGTSYGSAKAGVARLTDTLAGELDESGVHISVHAMMPGLVRSTMTESLATSPDGRRWLPQVVEGLGTDEEVSADRVAAAVLELGVRASELPTGRILRWDDDIDDVARAIHERRAAYRIRWSRPDSESVEA